MKTAGMRKEEALGPYRSQGFEMHKCAAGARRTVIDYEIQIKAATAACHGAHALWHLKSGFATFQVIRS